MTITIRFLCTVLLIGAFLCGCSQSPEEAFNDAKKGNTVTGYEKFLNKYPDSQYATQAKKSLEELKWLGKKVLVKDTIVIQGSSGNWLLDMAAQGIMQSKYIVTYSGVVESVLGESLKIVIDGYKVDMMTTDGRTSPAQHENMPQAKEMASQMLGRSVVVDKAVATISG
jgi:hypothetical protein